MLSHRYDPHHNSQPPMQHTDRSAPRNAGERTPRPNATRDRLHTASADRSHSCALRWYAVGRLAYEHRFAHLDEQESKDFRVQFGDTWNLVATMLGHRNPQTTRDHYLEPFRSPHFADD